MFKASCYIDAYNLKTAKQTFKNVYGKHKIISHERSKNF